MSFDIHLIKFSKGQGCELPRERVRSLLHQHEYHQQSEDSFDVQFKDGSHVEFLAHGLASSDSFKGCAFWIRGMSTEIIRFVFEVAKEADTVLFPTMEGNPCILVRPDQRVELPGDLDLPIVECSSPEELGRLVMDGYQAWLRYRNHVLQDCGESNPTSKILE